MFFFNYEIKFKNGKQSEVISYFTNEKEVLFRENNIISRKNRWRKYY